MSYFNGFGKDNKGKKFNAKKKKGNKASNKNKVKKENNMVHGAYLDKPTIKKLEGDGMRYSALESDKVDVEIQDITLVIPRNVYNKMMTFVKLLDDEINGLGMIEQISPTHYRVTDIYLLKQTVSKAACDIDSEAMVKLMEQLIAEGKNPSMLRFWWHSHNSMGTFWSSTDEKTGEQFAGSEYLFSLVANHAESVRAKMNIYKPVELAIDNINVVIENPIAPENMMDECIKEIEECVETSKTYSYSPTPLLPGYHQGGQFIEDPEDILHSEDLEQMEDEAYGHLIAPYGDHFVDKGVRLIWNNDRQEYEGFDVATNEPMTDWEIEQKCGIDYNFEYVVPKAD